MTMRSYEERVRLRLLTEGRRPLCMDYHDAPAVDVDSAARIAAREHQDTVDPLSHHPRTAVLRPALELVLDEEALARAVGSASKDDGRG